jgi:predicted metal-dependent phosphotriesterase family hydrolase
MDDRDSLAAGLSRRELLALLRMGTGLSLVPWWNGGANLSAAARQVGAARVTFPRGAIIRTLFKDIPPDQLGGGPLLFHEHLSIDLPQFGPRPANAPPPQPPPTSNVDLIIEEVKAAEKDGVKVIVDGGHTDMKRNLDNLKQIATRTGMLIVASGGYYMERVYPPDLATKSEDQIADELVREANANRYGALGEIGENPDAVMSPLEQKVFRAVGKAHLRTNLPIFTHNAYGTGPSVPKDAGLHQLDVLEAVGVKPEHVVIGHCDSLVDPSAELIKAVAKRGAWVGYDRVGGRPEADEVRVRTLLTFFEAGYADRLLLSSDSTGGATVDLPVYRRVTSVFVPLLLKAGVKEETIHAILVDNARRFLAFVPKSA